MRMQWTLATLCAIRQDDKTEKSHVQLVACLFSCRWVWVLSVSTRIINLKNGRKRGVKLLPLQPDRKG